MDNGAGNYPQPNRRDYEPRRFKSLVAERRRETKQGHPREADERSHEAPLVSATRRLVVATVALAAVGFLGFSAAVLQWLTLRSTDQTTSAELAEMKSQRLVSIAQTRASLHRDTSVHAVTNRNKLANIGEKVIGFAISPYWRNGGGTEARDYRGWFDMKTFDIGPVVPRVLGADDCPEITAPSPLPDVRVVLSDTVVVQLAKFLPIEDALGEMNGTKYILIWGHVEYKDIYFPETPAHFDDWCVSVAPNDVQREAFSFISLREKVE